MTIMLTTLGSAGVPVDVAPAALPEAGAGGVQVEFGLRRGPLTITFTRDEAFELAEEVQAMAGNWAEVELVVGD